MDRNASPGDGWFFDAADGWKQSNPGGTPQAPVGPTPEELAQQEATRQLNSGYDSYLAMLDEQIGGLQGREQSQVQSANETNRLGVENAQLQKQQGIQDLTSNRQKTLRDLSDNLSQSFKQGNIYLGTRGASDSSAANQYSYALAKEGNRARGDVQSEFDNNMFKLNNIYNTETNKLQANTVAQINQISEWFANAQSQFKTQKGVANLERSQQAYQTAIQWAQQTKEQADAQKAKLDEWALNHATSYQQLAGQLEQGGAFNMPAPQIGGLTNQGYKSAPVATDYGATTTKDEPYAIASMADGRTRYSDGSIR